MTTLSPPGYRLAISLACALALAGCKPARSAEGEKHALVGAPAPAFELPAQAGGDKASLEAASGKVTLVDFWATWCEPCRESFPKYQELADRYKDKIVIIGISEDDSADGIAAFAQSTGAKFTLAWDRGKAVADQYQPGGMPTCFIVDTNGLVRYVHAGYRAGDEQTIAAQLEELLK